MGENERKQFLSQVIAAPDGYAHKVLSPNVVIAHDLRTFLTKARAGCAQAKQGCSTIDIATRTKYSYMSFGGDVFTPSLPAAAFFSGLFKTIEKEGTHKLSESGLWHGHLVLTTQTDGNQSTAIVFHAKELPQGAPRAALGKGTRGAFDWKDAVMAFRNLLWLERTNKIYILDCTQGKPLFDNVIEDHAKEMEDPPWFQDADLFRNIHKIDQAWVGRQLIDIYYFTQEKKPDHPVRTIACGPPGA
jgi:hypothetical protein